MSSSFISTASGTSAFSTNGTSPSSPSPAVPHAGPSRPGLSSSSTFSSLAGLGRKNKDKSTEKDRAVPGGSLTRKLSVGMVPKKSTLTRTSSAAFKSMGFGKKDKGDKNAAHVALDEAEESTGLMRRD
jgi:hypothetical protein